MLHLPEADAEASLTESVEPNDKAANCETAAASDFVDGDDEDDAEELEDVEEAVELAERHALKFVLLEEDLEA